MAELSGIFAVSHVPAMSNLPDAPDADVRDAVYAGFRKVGEDIAALTPDVIVLVSDDHLHNFFLDALPAFAVGAAARYSSPVEGWLRVPKRDLPGDARFAEHLINSLFDQDFDPTLAMEMTLDHGVATPLELAGISARFPIVPLTVNCVQPPLPRMRRCVALGAALRRAIESYDAAGRVVILATGGLSHDVGTPRMGMVNEAFDRGFLERIAADDVDALIAFSEQNVASAGNGTEEIRNWLVAHGAAGGRGFSLDHYSPVNVWYTGIGIGRWAVGQ